MTDTHGVISAFLDDEPFHPEVLAGALADPEGRAILIDAVLLRCVLEPREAAPPTRLGLATTWWRVTAAAVVLAAGIGGGYAFGSHTRLIAGEAAPEPTRVVEAVPVVGTGEVR